MSLQNKKSDYHFKGHYQTTCYKANSNFYQFFFSHWLLHKWFFSFVIKAFVNFEKLIIFHRQVFIVFENWRKFENTDTNISRKTYSF